MKFAIVDIEGTGGSPKHSRIMEIAVIIFDGHEVTEQFSTLINPGKSIDPYVRKLTGITPKMLKRAPAFHEVAKHLVELFKNKIFTAHNADYDYAMLRNEFKRLGYDFQAPVLDTFQLAGQLINDVPSHGLDALTKSLRIPVSNRHRAMGDAQATLEILKILLQKDLTGEMLKKYIKHPEKINPIPQALHRKIYYLPDAPGILKILDKKNKPLYIAYTKHLRQKAEKIFSARSSKAKEMAWLTGEIEHEIIFSPVLGKIKETVLRKKLKPAFNRRQNLRRNEKIILPSNTLLVEKKNMNGTKTLFWVDSDKIKGYAQVKLNWQMQDMNSLKKRLIPLENSPEVLCHLHQAYRQNRFDIIPLNGKDETAFD